jgi:carboxymethylenebutenolidase
MSTTHNNGYLALPPSGSGDPVLMLHAWWGLNATFKGVCDRLAQEGFFAYAPDLHHGKIATTIPDAEALVTPIFGESGGLDRVRADIDAAMVFLRERAGQSEGGMSMIGFSMGAFFALDAAIRLPQQVRSVVAFYGTRPSDAADFANSKASFLGHYAETDDFEPAEEVDKLEAALKAAGRPVTFHHYPGTGHWFFEPDVVQAYDAAAAALAWERTLAFLKQLPE